jgi:predicted O-methyltransferase YrrM
MQGVAQRAPQLVTITGYGARQIAIGLRGKVTSFAQVYDVAWFQSSRKMLPTASLEEVFPGSAKLSIRLERSLPKAVGNVTMEELAVIAVTCQWLKPSVLFEFGTFNGRTTLNLAANSPAGAKIYTLDIPDPGQAQLTAEREDGDYHLRERSGNYFRNTEFSPRIEQLWCDSARFDETALRGQVDLVFVDAAHSYDYVASDTTKALAMVRPGGAVMWHDYCSWYPGVYGYLHQLLPGYPLKHIERTHLAVLRA